METPYTPPYEVSDTVINLIAGIVDSLKRLELGMDSGVLMHLRKDHQLRSIHSSLAIENNSLSLEQVTDVVNGRRVRGDPREILEVKNAFAAYSALAGFKPFKVSDFLKAHAIMMDGLVVTPGHFRMSGVGVFAGAQLIHKQNTSNSGAVNGVVNGVVNTVHEYVLAHGGCRANAVAEALGIPFRSVQRHLSSLRKAGRIEFRGAPKNGGYWRVE